MNGTKFNPALWWLLRFLGVSAALISAWLLLHTLGRVDIAGCGGEAGCGKVLGSKWSKWFYLPVSAGGLGLYAALFAGLLRCGPGRPPATWLYSLSATGAAAALWFIGLQLVIIGQFCVYCTVVHGCGLAIAGMLWWQAKGSGTAMPPLRWAGAAAAVAVLASGQLAMPDPGMRVEDPTVPKVITEAPSPPAPRDPPAIAEPPAASDAPRAISLFAGQIRLDTASAPILGPRDAEHVLGMLFDYTCKDCRKAHGLLEQVVERFQGRIAVMLLPCPLEKECNPHVPFTHKKHEQACRYAKLALIVWKCGPDKFAVFDHWLTRSETHLPTFQEALNKAFEIAGKETVLEKNQSEENEINRLVSMYTGFYGTVNTGAIPKLILPARKTMSGAPRDFNQLLQAIEQQLGITAPAAAP